MKFHVSLILNTLCALIVTLGIVRRFKKQNILCTAKQIWQKTSRNINQLLLRNLTNINTYLFCCWQSAQGPLKSLLQSPGVFIRISSVSEAVKSCGGFTWRGWYYLKFWKIIEIHHRSIWCNKSYRSEKRKISAGNIYLGILHRKLIFGGTPYRWNI